MHTALILRPFHSKFKPWPLGKLVKIRHCPRNGNNETYIRLNHAIYTTVFRYGKVDI